MGESDASPLDASGWLKGVKKITEGSAQTGHSAEDYAASQVSRETLAFEYWIAHTVLDVSDRNSALTGFMAGITWHRMLIRHDARAKELTGFTKAKLIDIAYHHDEEWTLNTYSLWSKDELINRVLDVEYPDARPRPEL